MSKYAFGDIAINSTEKRTPTEADMETYIGLEHLDAGSLTIKRWGSKVPIKGDKTVMRKGDVLFGKRNAYLRRAAVCPHDGLFSAHGMVLRPKTEVIDKDFFPLFIASDYFFDAAIKISVGSLSPTVNWSDLKRLEFSLPPLDEQRRLAKILWSAFELKEAYQMMLARCDEMASSRFIEMFGDPVKNTKGWEIHNLSDFIEFLTSGSRGWSQYFSNTGEYFITIKNVRGGKLILDDVQYVSPPNNAEAARTKVQEGDLLISITADLGRTAVVSRKVAEHGGYINQHLSCIRLNRNYLDPFYVANFLESDAGKRQFAAKNQNAVKAGLNFNSIRSLRIPTPPLPLQRDFIAFIEQLDKSKVVVSKQAKILSDAPISRAKNQQIVSWT